MSHELRTPLNAIIGFSEMISEAMIGPLDARYRGYGGDINAAGCHLQNLINDILDISKIEGGRLELRDETVSIVESIEACRRIVAAMASRRRMSHAVDQHPGRSTGYPLGCAALPPDPAQPDVERGEVHAGPRPRARLRRDRRRQRGYHGRRYRHRHARKKISPSRSSRSARSIIRAAALSRGATTAPVLDCRSRKRWSNCMVARSRSKACCASARPRAFACRSSGVSKPRLNAILYPM